MELNWFELFHKKRNLIYSLLLFNQDKPVDASLSFDGIHEKRRLFHCQANRGVITLPENVSKIDKLVADDQQYAGKLFLNGPKKNLINHKYEV